MPDFVDVSSLAVSTHGEHIVTGSSDGTAKLWDARSGSNIRTLTHEEGVCAVAFHRDAHDVITSCWGVLRVWDVESGTNTLTFKLGEGFVSCISFSPNDAFLAGVHNGVRLWNAANGVELLTFGIKDVRCCTARFARTAGRLVTGHENGMLAVWLLDL
jgi:WD40 repeat protein